MSVNNFGILSVVCCLCSVVCSASTACNSLCRCLKYFLRVRYIILVYPIMDLFSIFETLCLGKSKTLPYVWKLYHKNERHLCLVANSFTKLSQNVSLINSHILIYRHARYNCKSLKELWFFCFFGYFHIFLTTNH